MRFDDEFFGSDAQQSVSRWAQNSWRQYADDPRYSYNGRIVTSVGDLGAQTGEVLISLAKLQGTATAHLLPKNRINALQNEIETYGYSHNLWDFLEGGKTAYDAAQKVLEAHQLPTDITVERLTVETSVARIRDFADMALGCGVLPMCGRVIRGLDVQGITLAGFNQAGEAVASAWGYKCYHPKSSFADYAFWGGLSCREDRRGQKIALIMGALSIVQLWEELQVRNFCTGVAAGNDASVSVCNKLGISSQGRVALGVTNTQLFGEKTLTK